MKRKIIMLTIVVLWNAWPLLAQKNKMESSVYRRSSLHTVLLESGDYLKKDMVINAYNLAPFPEKYNDHRLTETSFDPKLYGASDESQEAAANNGSDGDKEGKAEKELIPVLKKYIKDKKIANQLVAKWFDRKDDGTFDMNLIHDRGSYNASEMEAQIARGSIRGLASLKDAGEELIKNTFVVFNKMSFVENEPIALATKTAAVLAANRLPSAVLRQAAIASAEKTYQATREGYSVWTTSYLFQLDWNDDIANTFYMDMWMDKSNIDPARKALFDTTSIFTLSYIGYQKAKSVILFSAGKSEGDIIQQATIRNIDKVYTKLQKAYDVFKTKTPIYSVDPIVAKIGLKEGVEPDDKFEVLEQTMDEKTGLTKYSKVATIKVDNDLIWDNRYNMGIDDEVPKNADLDGTHFKGSGKVEPGMLLRQVK